MDPELGGAQARRAAAAAATKLARATDRLARHATAVERAEEVRAAARTRQRAAASQAAAASPEPWVTADASGPGGRKGDAARSISTNGAVTPEAKPRTRALLIINTKSGPNNDSVLHVKPLVEQLATHGIAADVRVKLRKKQAAREARRAARKGLPLVIAAGGDGTIAAVARGLVGTKTVLGVIALGTYNNVATCLGIPMDTDEACALIASGAVRAVDVGQVTAAGRKTPRLFLEMGAVGLAAAMMTVGQDLKEGRWDAASAGLPAALQMAPAPAEVRLDGAVSGRRATTLLVEVANAPRNGPAVVVVPEARMDDGLLDVAIYHDLAHAALTARFLALKAGLQPEEARIERARARLVEVRAAAPLPVVADNRVVGTTPARFEVRPGALLVAAGRGIGLAHPPAAALVEAATEARAAPATPPEAPPAPLVVAAEAAPARVGVLVAAAAALVPLAGRTLGALRAASAAALPAASAVGGAVAGAAAAAVLLRRLRP